MKDAYVRDRHCRDEEDSEEVPHLEGSVALFRLMAAARRSAILW